MTCVIILFMGWTWVDPLAGVLIAAHTTIQLESTIVGKARTCAPLIPLRNPQ